MALRKDLWRVGLVRQPLADLLNGVPFAANAVHWLPALPGLCFDADPMAIWRDGKLYVFVETYDYRTRHGAIDVLTLDADFHILDRQPALRAPWHLSYPYLIETNGALYMLPEAHRSGHVTLYRCTSFPNIWEAVARIDLDVAPIDATPVWHDGLWWLFYTPATSRADKVSALHLAFAERLEGPWTPHPGNPVVYDPSCARPGGTPVRVADQLIVPMQDCRRTYGGGIRPLRIEVLSPSEFVAQPAACVEIPAGFAPYTDGLHTMCAAGPVTLIDAKQFRLSAETLLLDMRHEMRRLIRR